MIAISYSLMFACISILWVIVRAACYLRTRKFSIRREAALMLVYICIVVVVRFTFCPFGKVNGQIQPLLFDPNNVFPFWMNLMPLVYLFDYPTLREILVNLIGNVAMFIPLGIVWPSVFPELNTAKKAIAAGFGASLIIEIIQLPFFSRCSDIDDLILNTTGYILGYGIYRLVRFLAGKLRK